MLIIRMVTDIHTCPLAFKWRTSLPSSKSSKYLAYMAFLENYVFYQHCAASFSAVSFAVLHYTHICARARASKRRVFFLLFHELGHLASSDSE
jgi:hypothetical protein